MILVALPVLFTLIIHQLHASPISYQYQCWYPLYSNFFLPFTEYLSTVVYILYI